VPLLFQLSRINKIDYSYINTSLYKNLMTEKMNRVDQMMKIQQEALALFTRKNADYGDAFATYGAVGVIVRLGDKISRLQSVTQRGVTMVDTESLRDTLIDLHNYAAMAAMLLDEKKLLHPRVNTVKQMDTVTDTSYPASG